MKIINNLICLIIFSIMLTSIVNASPINIYNQTFLVNYSTAQIIDFDKSINDSTVKNFTVDVQPLYNESSPYNIPTNGLVAWWKFDESTGIYVNDSSGNNINGTIQNGMNWTTDGKYNNAGEFDNVNDQVTFSSDLLKINNTMTYCCFVRPHGCTQGRLLYDPDGTVQNRNYMYWISTSYHPGIQVANGTNTTTITSTLTVTKNNWNFVAFSINNTSMKVYVDNNTELLTLPYNITSMSNNTARIIGGTSTSSVLNATVDNVLVYNRTLNDSEIKQIYYDNINELQFRTNANNTYSSKLNTSGIVSIPYNSTDTNINTLSLYAPNTTIINSVTIRDYNKTVTPFNINVYIESITTESVNTYVSTFFNSIYNIFFRNIFQVQLRLI